MSIVSTSARRDVGTGPTNNSTIPAKRGQSVRQNFLPCEIHILVFFVDTAVIHDVEDSLFGDMRIIGDSLDEQKVITSEIRHSDRKAHACNLIGNFLCFTLTLFEINS
jgi:hypothetical protein